MPVVAEEGTVASLPYVPFVNRYVDAANKTDEAVQAEVMYVCTCVYMYVYMYTFTYTCIHTFM